MPALFVRDLKMGTRFQDFNGDPGGDGLSDRDDDNGDNVDDDYDS